MKRFLGFLVFTLALSSLPAKADLLIEPLVGYNMGLSGEFKEADLGGGVTVEKDSFSGGGGPAYGARLGYQKLGFQIGLDYLHSTINPDDKAFKGSLRVDEWAAFVGFEFPILLRVYGGYIFSATAEGKMKDGSTISKLTMSDGTGLKAGVGFTLLPFLDINLEYRRGTFSEWKSGSMKVDGDVDYNVYMIGLSLPFTI